MNFLRLIIFFIFIFLVMRLVIRMLTALGRGKRDQVRGQPRNNTAIKNKKDIEDAEYEELE
jgi:F0F1-type ATP synthase membrane subunit b/b'